MSRKNVRKNRRMKAWNIQQEKKAGKGTREEMIALRDKCGIKDPTPYEAVKKMVRQQKIAHAYRSREIPGIFLLVDRKAIGTDYRKGGEAMG